MPVAVDTSEQVDVPSNVTSKTWTHTTAVGAGYMWLGFTVNATSTPTVTYDGVGMTQKGAVVQGSAHSFVYRLINPHSGAKTVSVSGFVSGYFRAACITFKNVAPGNEEGTIQTATIAYQATVENMTIAAGRAIDCVVDYIGGVGPGGGGVGETAAGTEFCGGSGDYYLAAAAQYRLASTLLNWTFTGNIGPCTHYGIVVRGAGAGGQVIQAMFSRWTDLLERIRSGARLPEWYLRRGTLPPFRAAAVEAQRTIVRASRWADMPKAAA